MAREHGAPDSGQLSKAWTRGRREKEFRKSERRKRKTAQNEMRMKRR